jgi:glutamate-1-semialdehyde 2,1-aminomutase
MPGGLVGNRADIMDVLTVTGEPARDRTRVRHGGTYNGNVLAAAAALATLKHVATGEPTRHAAELGAGLRDGINAIIRRLEIGAVAYGESSTFHIYFGQPPAGVRVGDQLWVEDAVRLKSIPRPLVDTFRWALQLHGVDLMSGTGGVLSALHTRADVDQTLASFEQALAIVREAFPELAL